MAIYFTPIFEDGNFSYPFNVDAECTDIHYLNSSLQCLFAVTAQDCVKIIEYIDYNYYTFCSFGLQRVWIPVLIFAVWLLFLFTTLGVSSNYFLCPALFTISNHLGLSQNVAGVTLLAFGNASPDIFSSVASLQKASAELAIASLLGAGVFVTLVVAGSVFLTQSFKLMVRPFLRDIAFYSIGIVWTFALFFTDNTYLYHGIGFVALYFLYIVVVIGSRFIYVNKQKEKECEENKKKMGKKNDGNKDSSHENIDTSLNANEQMYIDDCGSTAVVLKAFYYGGFEWLDGGGRRLSRIHMFQDGRRFSNLKSNGISGIENTGCAEKEITQDIQIKALSSTEKLWSDVDKDKGEFWNFLVKVCPINNRKWHNLKWWKKLIALFKSPSILIMRLTVPVLDTSEEDLSWNKYLICLQCITGPIFITIVSEYAFLMIGGVFPVLIPILMVCSGCSLLVYYTSERDVPPPYHWLFAYLGFFVAVAWIYCLANEIVALLQVFGVIFNLSEAILGLTILAWGNSISDFLSNIVVARKNYPRMAISACFGGPLLALLLGLGIPCIIEVVKGRSPAKDSLIFSAQFAFLFVTIGIGLLTTTCIMSFWKFETKRVYGVFLILLYVAFVIASVLEEMNIFTLPI